MGIFDGLDLFGNYLTSKGVGFDQESKKPCTEEERKEMIQLIEEYHTRNSKEARPIDFGRTLVLGPEIKKILINKKIKKNCYIPPENTKKDPKSVDENEECFKDSDCVEDLVCYGSKEDIIPGKCSIILLL